MTRFELLKILVGQARANGFEFRRFYTTRLLLPWHGADKALHVLDQNRHYYALLFSHDFAQAFWMPGKPITFQVPAKTFERRMSDGSIGTVQRKPFVRRTTRPDAWRYHLREMALAEEPLRYMRRYLNIADDLSLADLAAGLQAEPQANASTAVAVEKLPPVTLALARKAHERKQLDQTLRPIAKTSKRGARLPGTRSKST